MKLLTTAKISWNYNLPQKVRWLDGRELINKVFISNDLWFSRLREISSTAVYFYNDYSRLHVVFLASHVKNRKIDGAVTPHQDLISVITKESLYSLKWQMYPYLL